MALTLTKTPMSSLQPSRKRGFSVQPVELALLFLTILATSLSAWWIHHLGMTTALTDASAHLNFSRLMTDSLTPGISQIGFWPPLLQLVMAPYAANGYLYRTGLAGFFALIPFICLGTIALFRLVRNLTNSQALGVSAVVLFLLNPYVLYYSSVPMMEMLFVSNLLVTAYALVRWLQNHEIRHIIWLGLFVALTSMSRYEGLFLLPLVGVILLIDLYRQKTNRTQMEATLLLFAMLGIVGFTFIAIYGLVFGGSPLAFTDSSWIRDPSSNLAITKFNLAKTATYLLSGSYYLISKPMVWLAGLSMVLIPIIPGRRFQKLAALALLVSPLFFVGATLFTGTDSVLTTNLFPFNFFHNDRYTLTWVGFAILAPLLVLSSALAYSKTVRWIRPLALGAVSLTLAVLGVYNGYHTYTVAYAQHYPTIQRNINGPLDPQRGDQEAVANFLKSHYDFGYILLTRSNEDPVLHAANVPLQKYIYEANYRYFAQSTTDPEIFARFVIIHNPSDKTDTWSAQHDTIANSLNKTGALKKYYRLAYENQTRQVYTLNQTAVLQEAIDRGYNPQLIPSLADQNTVWSPSTVYTALAATTGRPQLITDKVALHSALQSAYDNTLRPQFRKGWYVDAAGKGSSESQAYALKEALNADDPATFATVWKWTETHLKRSDNLYSNEFSMTGDQVTIGDTNSATSADTDIAVALIAAGQSWKNPAYTAAGKTLITAIWNNDTEYDAMGHRHVLAGNWGRLNNGFITNAQALDPAAYHLFATIDSTNNWGIVADQAYLDLTAISQPEFTGHTQFLPINWAVFNPTTGKFSKYADEVGNDDISYGSFRAIWYVAQDYEQNSSPAAKSYLAKLTSFSSGLNSAGKLCVIYTFEQPNTLCYVDGASLAAPVSALQVTNPGLAEKAVGQYALNHQLLIMPKDDFFQQSWYWFMLYGWTNRR